MDIWEEIRTSPEEGAKRLVAEFGDRLYEAARILCRDECLAEDLVFRTFARVVDKISLFKPEFSFWNWIYTILINIYRSDVRKMHVVPLSDPSIAEEISDSAEEVGLCASDAETLRSAVGTLSPLLREAVMLRYFEDKSLAEMAEILQISKTAVKSRLYLARVQLRTVFARRYGGAEEWRR